MKFCDPHPGRMGAIIPLPESIKFIANELNGKDAILGEFELPNGAVFLLKNEAAKLVDLKFFKKADVKVYDDYIGLSLEEESGMLHMFRVISFKE